MHAIRPLRASVALLAGLTLTACAVPSIEATGHGPTRHVAPVVRSTAPTTADPTPTSGGAALSALSTLPVKGRAPMTGYSREAFGQAWPDADRNGCDTRNDVLGRDLRDVVHKPGTRDCVALSGRLEDPYTARRIDFVRGDGTLVDIDHVVALGNAWVTGAFRWPVRERAALANDPLN